MTVSPKWSYTKIYSVNGITPIRYATPEMYTAAYVF
jgi:hypothetical protein